MKDVEILLGGPMPPLVMDGVATSFTAHRPWEAADPAAYLAGIGPRIRGLATSSSHGRIDDAYLAHLPRLEIIASYGVGYDSIDVAAAARRGIVVTNTPDVLTDEVADLALGLLLATVRQLPQADRFLRSGRWLEKSFPLTATLRERKVGILGLGRIGKAIARRCEAFGLPIAYHGRHRQDDLPYAFYGTPAELAAAVDVLMVVTPGGTGTRHLVDASVLQALGPTGILINVSRGSVVDEAALIRALRDGTILSAGLDVFEDEPRVPSELVEMEHVVLLPHVGSGSVHTRNAMGQLVVDNLAAWFSGKGPLTPVPETPWAGRTA
ncbi:2-hydroxyacid dehydrogenase [Arenibaculum pallidiluteum]|uniref:2-hydroxyacid dehydrogenase n=1 Tax=Arenibaculum pallidiluteum TaxID=2812559 RepID=UPI002E2D8474|nr:2-hydroxyacid dehydrogenase [Arenibaculum pallidiluteum]